MANKGFQSIVSKHNNFMKLDLDLMKILGYKKALILCLICRKQETNSMNEVFFTREELHTITGMSNGTINKTIDELEKDGLLEVKRQGKLNRNYYKPNREEIAKLYTTYVDTSEPLTLNLDKALNPYKKDKQIMKLKPFLKDYVKNIVFDSYDQKNEIEDLITSNEHLTRVLEIALNNYKCNFKENHPRCNEIEELKKVYDGFSLVNNQLADYDNLYTSDYINWFYQDSDCRQPYIATMLSLSNMTKGMNGHYYNGNMDYLECFFERYEHDELDLDRYRY